MTSPSLVITLHSLSVLSYPRGSSQQVTEQTVAASCSDPDRSFLALKSPILYVGNLPFTYAQRLLCLVAYTYVRPCLSCRSTAHPISATTRFYRKGFLMNDLGRVHYEEGSAPVTTEDTGGAGGRWEAHRKINKKREREKVFYTVFWCKMNVNAAHYASTSFLSPLLRAIHIVWLLFANTRTTIVKTLLCCLQTLPICC